MTKLGKKDRQEKLLDKLKSNPFMTDEELASYFQVSIQTIRLDRLEKSIPELRERIKSVAEQNYDEVRSLAVEEVIGEIIDLQLDHSAISILDICEEHVFSRNQIARGHHLFAQANSLAIAVINEELALTSSAQIQFLNPVKAGQRIIAKARVTKEEQGNMSERDVKGRRTKVLVQSYVGDEMVFSGEFLIYRTNKDE